MRLGFFFPGTLATGTLGTGQASGLSLDGSQAAGKEMAYPLRKMHQEFKLKKHPQMEKMNLFYSSEIKNLYSSKTL